MIKLKSNLVFLFLVFSLNGFTQKPADKRLAGLDTAVVRTLKDWKAPGVSIAVVDKNKVVYTGGFGYRNVEKKLPVTDNTLFAIGSCTKAFTASMLGTLVKEGHIDLDKPVRDYLPELKFFNDQLDNQVTLRDMMCHRTGLPRHDYNTTLFALLPPQPDYELVPSGKDEFKLKIMDGFSVNFTLDDQGKAIEAVFVQPNGMFTAKRKE